MPFSGNVALVTGAASGVGQLATWRLAAHGVRVVAVDVDDEGLARTARRTPQVETVVADVRDAEQVEVIVSDTEKRLGPVDRVVNAAAIAPCGSLTEQPLDEIRRVMEVNYIGLVTMTKAVLPRMLERRRGDLVQVGWLARALPSRPFGAYAAANAAVVSLTESLEHELKGSGLRIACVAPRDLERECSPEEVLDSIERALDRGRLFAVPGRDAATLRRVRRFRTP
jgi:NAD(P)-dependent dehydrogenase (short-subunit alcohol dehydrogenase family)